MQWATGPPPPHVLLHTLSKHRPRWLVELSRVAAKRAATRGTQVMERGDIFHMLQGEVTTEQIAEV